MRSIALLDPPHDIEIIDLEGDTIDELRRAFLGKGHAIRDLYVWVSGEFTAPGSKRAAEQLARDAYVTFFNAAAQVPPDSRWRV